MPTQMSRLSKTFTAIFAFVGFLASMYQVMFLQAIGAIKGSEACLALEYLWTFFGEVAALEDYDVVPQPLITKFIYFICS